MTAARGVYDRSHHPEQVAERMLAQLITSMRTDLPPADNSLTVTL